ncbi:MAG: hypothetical protein U0172_06195 [Nitrospiraceae bacterium]
MTSRHERHTTLRRRASTLALAWRIGVLLTVGGCGAFETGYFEGKERQVTKDVVQQRYGPPHRVSTPSPDRETWTYFDRGSSVGGFAGHGRAQPCTAYRLNFDLDGVLQEWARADCSS